MGSYNVAAKRVKKRDEILARGRGFLNESQGVGGNPQKPDWLKSGIPLNDLVDVHGGGKLRPRKTHEWGAWD